MSFSQILEASAWIIPVLLAVTLHEAAHGFIAERFGDDTARKMGRVSFNPFRHIDPIGTILMPALLLFTHSPILLGYAKPVPVDFTQLKPMRMGMCAVALAGPGMNILLAFLGGLLLHLGAPPVAGHMSWWQLMLVYMLTINCALALFNMLPILPLDGGRVLKTLLPKNLGERYATTERYGMLVVMGLFIFPPLFGIYTLVNALMAANHFLMQAILFLTGNL
jgi:Zn-dependent protease